MNKKYSMYKSLKVAGGKVRGRRKPCFRLNPEFIHYADSNPLTQPEQCSVLFVLSEDLKHKVDIKRSLHRIRSKQFLSNLFTKK